MKALLTVLLFSIPCWSQQAIVNLPSADITPEGRHFLMNESFIGSKEWSSVNFYTYGVGNDTEFCATLYDLASPPRRSFAAALGYKSQFDLAEDGEVWRELKLTHGLMLPVNLRGGGVGAYGYVHASGRLSSTDTRLTLGLAGGTSQLFGQNTLCVMTAVEHPLTEEVSLVAEWFSGRHELGNLITGVVYHNHEHDFMVVGSYKIPNHPGVTSPGFVLEFGGFF